MTSYLNRPDEVIPSKLFPFIKLLFIYFLVTKNANPDSVVEEFPVATHFTAFNPIKAKYSFHSSSCLWWKLLVGEEGLIGYSWYRQNTLECRSGPEVN